MFQLVEDLVLISQSACCEYVIAIIYFVTRCLRFLRNFRWIELIMISYTLCMDILFFPLMLISPDIRLFTARNHLTLIETARTQIEQDFQVLYNEVQRRLSDVISKAHVIYHDEYSVSNITLLFVFAWKLYKLVVSSMKLFIKGARFEYVARKESMLQRMITTSDNPNP